MNDYKLIISKEEQQRCRNWLNRHKTTTKLGTNGKPYIIEPQLAKDYVYYTYRLAKENHADVDFFDIDYTSVLIDYHRRHEKKNK